VKHLIAKNLVKPSEILALTFTEKAAREMEERIDIALPYGYTEMWIATFHSFCDRILRNEALHIGLDPGYKLMTEAETIQFLIKNLFKFELNYFRPLGNPTKFVDGMLQHFSRLKDEDVSPEEYIKYVNPTSSRLRGASEETEKYLELARAYQKYEELKVKEGLMDFGDLIEQTLKLFRSRKNVLAQYQKQFKYILIDEFQDTNFAQYSLIKTLAPPLKKPNLTVVGDDSQSIYKFRGAAISNILQFMKDYPKAKQVILVDNYRSTQTILNHAYQLIKYNDPDTLEAKLGISKNLKAVRKIKEATVELIWEERVENEAEAVAKKIKELTDPARPDKENYEYKDFAILVRANNHADSFARALARAGIPYQFLGPGQLFRLPEVKNLIAYLKILYNFEDSVALYLALSQDIFAINTRDLAAINNYAKRYNLSLFEAGEQVNKIFVSQDTKDKIGQFITMVYRHLKLISKETAGQILYYYLQDTGLLKKLADINTALEERQAQNIAKFFDRLKTYEVDHEDATVPAVVDWLNLSMTLGESPLAGNTDWTEENRVNLLTVHSSKGLEFPVVFLVNLVAGRFPTRERREQIPIPEALIKEILPVGDYHQEEERRLFYVGMTRARDRLYLSAANYYGDGKRERKISPFVIEALGEKVVTNTSASAKASADKQLSIFDFKPAEEEKIPTDQSANRRIDYLSFSQIESFNTCPLSYKFRYLYQIPVPASSAQSFGSTIHKTLRDFYQQVINGQKPKLADLLSLLENNWISVGYRNKAHEKKMKNKGEEMLTDYFKQAYNPKIIPQSLEQVFRIRISPSLRLGGKIDRVDITKNGLEIIDYKTGKPYEQKKVDQSLQMTTYALAAIDKGIYDKKPEEVVMSFYFLETGQKLSTKRTMAQLEQARQGLAEKAKEIEKSDFLAKPSQLCKYCDYQLLCDAWK
jgi:DNA helicase-2/ATP-dependent DNA helicase PcrA